MDNPNQLPLSFYTRTDVVQVARDLLGKVIVTTFDGIVTAGIITETEAYRAPDDKACHAYGNRRTARTEVMFQEGGRAYIYLCYGIHHLFNVVTGPENMAHAVLIRAIEPVEGKDEMIKRRYGVGGQQTLHYKKQHDVNLTTGPGALARALGLHTNFTGMSLVSTDTLCWIEDRGISIQKEAVAAGKRIGVEYAEDCAEWPWRFWWKHTKFHK